MRLKALIESSLQLLHEVREYPFAVMFSGGKDSTLALEIVGLYAERYSVQQVYVIYNDTWLDPPPVRKWVYSHLEAVRDWAERNGKPFKVAVIKPPPGKDFFSLVLERGYGLPVIRMGAPWCSKEMKVRPTAKFLREEIRRNGYGNIVYIVGARISESVKRRKSLERLGADAPVRRVRLDYLGKVLFLSPIYYWSEADVFNYLRNRNSVYGDSFTPLLELYRRYGENGVKLRTGCWICPQVPRDYFLEAYARDHPEYRVVLEARRRIIEISENPKYRTRVTPRGNPAGRLTEEGRRRIAEVLCELIGTGVGEELFRDYLKNVPRLKEILTKYGCRLNQS